KNVIGTVTAPNLVMQNAFSDSGGTTHCWDAEGTSGSITGTAGVEQCWTTPAGNTGTLPPPTINLSAAGRDTIHAEWNDVGDETGFELWGQMVKGNSGQPYTRVASLPANTLAYNWTGLRRFTSYCMKVRADGGAFSQPDCAT